MADWSKDVFMHEAGGLVADMDIEIFRVWKKTVPGYDWLHAEVDHYEGLTLYCEGTSGIKSGLHFSHALCGYGGTGPQATVSILLESGFGSRQDLEAEVFNYRKIYFDK